MMNASFYENNRRKLGGELPNSLLFVAAHAPLQYSADVSFPFRQDSHFWYLCGLSTPDAVLVIDTTSDAASLLLPDQNDYQKEWDGVPDTASLMRDSGITHFGTLSDIPTLVQRARQQKKQIGYNVSSPEVIEPYGFYANQARRRLELLLRKESSELIDIRSHIGRLRMVKQPNELVLIRQAIDVTARALSEVKQRLSTLHSEKDIERVLSARFHEYADGHCFKPVIAAGKNAATIHYEKNDAPLRSKDLVLLDVGAQYQGYAADISRVWAVSGTPTPRQKDIWNACLAIQQKAFSLLKPGVYLKEYQEKVEQEVKRQCRALKCSMAGKKFPHGFSHFMGLDVHDAGDYMAQLQENVVLTVEPGIYLPDEGIGVRVEDDVMVTKSGIEILSKHIPQTL